MNCPICGTTCNEQGNEESESLNIDCPNGCYVESQGFGYINVTVGFEDVDSGDVLRLYWRMDASADEVNARRMLIQTFGNFVAYKNEINPPPPTNSNVRPQDIVNNNFERVLTYDQLIELYPMPEVPTALPTGTIRQEYHHPRLFRGVDAITRDLEIDLDRIENEGQR